MRSLFPVIIVLLLILSLSASAEVIRVDPNTPQAASQTEPEQQADTRLAQKVTYEAKKKTVSSIIADLSEMTGVTLNSGYNKQDWQVRDRKMNIFAKDVPLAHLMNSIARVMKFKWSKSDDPKTPSYRLYMDRQTLLNAESQKAREEERFKKQQAEKRQSTLEQFADLAKLSPQELAQLKEENPFLYIAKTSGIADSLSTLFGEVPTAVDALANGQEMAMSASRMSPRAQQGLLQAIQSLNKFEGMVSRQDNPLPDDIAQNIGQVTVTVNQSLSMMGEAAMGHSMLLGDITMNYNGRHFGVPIFDPNSKMAQLFGKMIVKSMDEGRPINEIGQSMQTEFLAAMISERKQSTYGEPLIEHEDDPALEEKVKLDIQGMGRELTDVEAELANVTSFAVVSDYFGASHGFVQFSNEETEIKKIMETIADGYNYNWDKQANVLELRDREWFRKRAAQIPESWLEEWREALKKNGTMSLDEMGQMAALTLEQVNTNIISDEVLGKANLGVVIHMGRDIIRFYSSLDQQQKQLLFSESGLNLKMLSPSQWSQIEKVIVKRNGAILDDPDANITITGAKRDDQYDFKLTTTVPDISPIHWTIPAPKYIEPKQDSGKDIPAKKAETE